MYNAGSRRLYVSIHHAYGYLSLLNRINCIYIVAFYVNCINNHNVHYNYNALLYYRVIWCKPVSFECDSVIRDYLRGSRGGRNGEITTNLRLKK